MCDDAKGAYYARQVPLACPKTVAGLFVRAFGGSISIRLVKYSFGFGEGKAGPKTYELWSECP
jgi:hypothetical protein